MLRKLNSVENNETLKLVMMELQNQNQSEVQRVEREKQKVSQLSKNVTKLEKEIETMKNDHYLDCQKFKLVVANLEDEVEKSNEKLDQEVRKNSKLTKKVDANENSTQFLNEALEEEHDKCKMYQQKFLNFQKNETTMKKEQLILEDKMINLENEVSQLNVAVNFQYELRLKILKYFLCRTIF